LIVSRVIVWYGTISVRIRRSPVAPSRSNSFTANATRLGVTPMV